MDDLRHLCDSRPVACLHMGYGGILFFGHGVFFGIGAYTYAIAAINMGETTDG